MSDPCRGAVPCSKGGGTNTCLRSLCIYCPSLSGGQETRAMDNILFFYPSHLHANTQMNHVGFCIGVSCLAERFAATGPVNEIHMSHTTVALCCPFPDLWIAVETAAGYDSSSVVPIVRRGFDVFVLRYGWPTVTALVSREDAASADAKRSRAALRDFFERFTVFLEARVLIVDILHSAVQVVRGVPQPLAPEAAGGHANTKRWSRRWAAVAGAESLLAFPVVIRAASPSVQSMCHSLVYRHLSLLSAKGEQCGSSVSSSSGTCGNTKNCTVGWGTEYHGVATPISATALAKAAEERLLWTCCQYVVFIGETLKVVAANAPHELVSKLICLMLIEPGVTDFAAYGENGLSHCYVCHASGIILVVVVDNSLYRSIHECIATTCNALARDIADFLTTGVCTLTRESCLSPSEMQQLALTRLNPSHLSTVAVFNTPMLGLPKFCDSKLTLQWTVWHDGMIAGSPMREYPRAVHVVLSSLLRAFVRSLSGDVGVGGRDDNDANTRHTTTTTTTTTAAAADGVVSASIDLPPTSTEAWVPLRDTALLCVMRENRRVGAMVFYNSAPLKNCFEAAAELQRQMAFLL
ncbi:hypothetical protein DQ04_02921000 [Trypanosoma grayi]|uniref:hypothetical protein n=1 Tax=Trypanosoma grayi TaxID=71804 RepID=UPI0004F45CCB|nr:hypothetical protein DQ04_02921000 [Trypanosoma grayi]KEG11153.1 hypothetical protein DQ04_02921000 [Trypanosoma grayi]